jgi:hypothetical protein
MRWQESRVDVAENTRLQHRSAAQMLIPMLGDQRVDAITPAAVADLVAALTAKGKARETVRKSLLALAMILDHEGVAPNPARDKITVGLPREESRRSSLRRPRTCSPFTPYCRHATGCRYSSSTRPGCGSASSSSSPGATSMSRGYVGESPEKSRRRDGHAGSVSRRSSSRRCAGLVPRDDRVPERRGFHGFGGDRFRTALTRACTAAGIPTFSPHGLRHRRISLLHLTGVPWARIGEHVGQRNLAVTANTYSHVLADEAELDYADLLEQA